jgi:hypothetical protein
MLGSTIIKSSRASLSSDKRRRGGIAFQVWTFLIVATICSFGVSYKMFGYTIRPERLLVIVWLLSIPFSIRLVRRFKIRKILLLLLDWILLSLFSSLFSAEPEASFRHWVDLTLAVGFFFVCQTAPLHLLILKRPSAIMWLSMILGGGAILTEIVLIYGTVAADSIWASFIMVEGDSFRIRMTLLEANVFGIAMSVFSLLSIAEFKSTDRLTWLSLVLSHTGLVLSFSRGPLVGYVLGLIVYGLVTKASSTLLKWGGALGLLIAVWWGNSIADFEFLQSQFDRAGTIDVRLKTLEVAMEDVANAPLIGHGIYSFDFLHPTLFVKFGAAKEASVWIPSLPVAILHDTGLVGLLLLYSFFIYVIWTGYKTTVRLRTFLASECTRRAGAWLGAAVSVLVASLTTSVYSLSLFWGIFAICYFIPAIIPMLKGIGGKVPISYKHNRFGIER